MTCLDLEIAVANHFNYRLNLIVPNVFWGLGFKHELDVAVMTPSQYLTEIEIKTTASDLRRDMLKRHAHESTRIRRHFFAVPKPLLGIAQSLDRQEWGILSYSGHFMECVRPAKINKTARPLSDVEANKLRELAAMRIWTLKKSLNDRIDRAKYQQAFLKLP